MEEEQFRGFGAEGESVHREGLARLRAMLGGARVAMLTTVDEGGALHSRPMVVQEITDDGDAWLLTEDASPKVDDVRNATHVNLAWHRPVRGRWVSVSGRASVERDRERLRHLWDPTLALWFPRGPDDPRLCLLRVRLDEAVVWDAALGSVGQMARMANTFFGRPPRETDTTRNTIVLRARSAGIGDTAGIFGTAGGSMGTVPAGPAPKPARGRATPARTESRAESRAEGRAAPKRTRGAKAVAEPEAAPRAPRKRAAAGTTPRRGRPPGRGTAETKPSRPEGAEGAGSEIDRAGTAPDETRKPTAKGPR